MHFMHRVPFCTMTEELFPAKKAQLALAIARGASITAWARANHVAVATAYEWASEPQVRGSLESCRRRALDRAIGRMARRATWAAGQIAKLGRDARSESVRLAALRAALSDMIAVTKFAGLEVRMTEIEEDRFGARADGTGRTS
ncbi:MAG: hypothetical protein ACLQIB_16085 [Isosphaeraceae bacterium]